MGGCLTFIAQNRSIPPLSYYNYSNDIITYKNNKIYSRKDEFTFVTMNDSVEFVENEVCYLVSINWLNQWLEYCTNDNITSIQLFKPEKIDNSSLIDPITGKVSSKVKIKKDFRTIKSINFEYLFSHYGGGPIIYITVPSGLSADVYKKGKWLKDFDFTNALIVYPEYKILKPIKESINARTSVNPIVEMSIYQIEETFGYTKIKKAIEMEKEIIATNNEAIAELFAKDLGKIKFQEAEKIEEEVTETKNEEIASLFVDNLAKHKHEEAEQARLEAIISEEKRIMETFIGAGSKHRFRGFLALGKIEEATIEAAIMLQSAWRSKLSKLKMEKQKILQQKLLEESYAIKLQGRWRVHKSKQKMKLLREKQLLLRQEGAAIMLQASYRFHQKRKKVLKLKLEQQKLLEEGSALIVQGAYRRKKAYKKLLNLRNEKELQRLELIKQNKAKIIIFYIFFKFMSKLRIQKLKKNQENLLFLYIESAANLYVANFTGSSDPFVYVQGIKGSDNSVINLYQTNVISSNLNPIWNEICYLPFISGNDKIVLSICDKDIVGSPNFLGQIVIDLKDYTDIFRGKEVVLSLPISSYKHPIRQLSSDHRLSDISINSTNIIPTGTLNLSIKLPPHATSHCGYIEKKTKGMFGLGLTNVHYKKRIMILNSLSIVYYDDIFNLCSVNIPHEISLLNNNSHHFSLLNIHEIKSLDYYKKDNHHYITITNQNKEVWDLKFCDNETSRNIKIWLWKLSNCCKHLPKLEYSKK